MRDHGRPESPIDVELYAQSQSQLRKFKSQLPPASVESLAREVLCRLVERDEDMSIEAPSDDQIEHLCHALLSKDDRAGAIFIQEARAAGASVDAVYLKYLAGAARMLGQWWEEDLASFSEVTLGTSRMYAIMRAIRQQLPIPKAAAIRSAIFASVPGETHTLGVRMAADLFRRDGWRIDLKIAETHDALVCDIAQSDTQLVGISAGGAHSLEALSRLIIALRIRKPTALVFVSGQIVEEAKDAVTLIGVDGMASDIDSARVVMGSICGALQG